MTRPAEVFWRQPHGPSWVRTYAASGFGPQRWQLGQALRAVAPFATALDLGCNCGVLVPWLTFGGENVSITGVDLSAEALSDAHANWPQHTWILDSVVDFLPRHAGPPWDIAVASSCLAHIAPLDLVVALDALTRVVAKAIVLQEVTVTPEQPREAPSPAGVMEWRYDYRSRLEAHGWCCAAFEWQDSTPDRPGAVMTFTRAN